MRSPYNHLRGQTAPRVVEVTMKAILCALVLAGTVLPASAISRYNTTGMQCDEVQYRVEARRRCDPALQVQAHQYDAL
jgi:hypothetical protein